MTDAECKALIDTIGELVRGAVQAQHAGAPCDECVIGCVHWHGQCCVVQCRDDANVPSMLRDMVRDCDLQWAVVRRPFADGRVSVVGVAPIGRMVHLLVTGDCEVHTHAELDDSLLGMHAIFAKESSLA